MSLEKWLKAAQHGRYSIRSLQLARNWIFALDGRPFKTPWIRQFFEAEPWYRADPDYSDDRLSEEDRRVVRQLLDLERQPTPPERSTP